MTSRTLYLIVFPLVWGISFMLLGAAAISARPMLPGDELRDLAIAWEMWRGGSFLVPHVNGVPDAEVLPLMSWLINAGWAVFGVSEFWPRLISPLFGFASVFVCAALGRILWPERAGIGALSATVLMGTVLWAVFSTLPGSAPFAVFALLLSFWGLMYSWRTGMWRGCALAGAALGVGVLAVGPVLLVYFLPVMAGAPLWGRTMARHETDATNQDVAQGVPGGWRNWYLQMLAVVALAVIIVLGWMVPAVLQGDTGYGDALLTHLLVGNLALPEQGVSPFAFGLVFTGLFLPWIIWSPAWRALAGFGQLLRDGGVWFCVLWILPVLVIFALNPGGGMQALMFSMPAFALIFGFLLYVRTEPEAYRSHRKMNNPDYARRYNGGYGRGNSGRTGTNAGEARSFSRSGAVFTRGESLTGLLIALLGASVIVVPLATEAFDLPWWVGRLAGGWGLIILVFGALIASAMPRTLWVRALALGVVSVMIVASGYLVAKPLRSEESGLYEAARRIELLHDQGIAVAIAGLYQGDFAFVGRLEKPLEVLDQDDPLGTMAWAAGNPGAEIITIHAMLPADLPPVAVFPWWGQYVVFWNVEAVEAHPEIILPENQQ